MIFSLILFVIVLNNSFFVVGRLISFILFFKQRILGLKAQRQPKRPPTAEGEEADTTQQRVRSNKKEGGKKDAAMTRENKQQPPIQQQADVRSSIIGTSSSTTVSNSSSSSSSNSSSIINSDDVQYSLVVKPSSGNTASKGKPAAAAAPGSKMKRLQRMLDTAVKKRQRLDDLKSVGAEGAEQLHQELWADAIDSATGAKTGGTDTGKLRKAIKKREKKKQASAAQWKDRLDAVENDKNARLDKREDNVAARHKKGGMGRPASLTAALAASSSPADAVKSSSSLSSISDKVKDIKKGRGPWPRPLPAGSSTAAGGGKFAGKGGKAATGSSGGGGGGRKGAGFEGRFQSSSSSSPGGGGKAGFLNSKSGKGGGGGHKNKK